MAPSKEAMAAAEKIVTVEKAVLGGYYVALCGTVVGISFPDVELATSGTKWYREQVATALDDHTATLRAEVEALRARVVRQEDSALVWEYIKEHGGKMEQAHGLNIHLWHHKSRWGNMEFVDIMRTRGSTFSSGSPDAIAKAAEWVRSQSE